MKLAVLDDYQSVARSFGPWERIADRVEIETIVEHIEDEDGVAERLLPFEIVVAMRERTRFDASLVGRLPNLRLLVATGRRNSAVDVEACERLGVTVCHTRSAAHGTSELTWALILAAARHLPDELTNVRSGRWMTTVGMVLHGARLGVVGLGRIGSEVARIGLAFGMDVVAWSEHLTAERCAEIGVELATKDEVFSTSDFVTVHVVLSERSRGLVGEHELGLMKLTAWFVNTSRGPICDERALVGACRQGRIAGACLDVFDEEPLAVDHPLRSLPNVLATPHLGYVTGVGYSCYFTDVVEDVEAFLDGAPIRLTKTL